jgi:acetyl-CoA acyltransferase
MDQMKRSEAFIIDAARTPVGKYGGVLRDIRPDDLSGMIIRALLTRTGIDPSLIGDVIWGCANQAGEDNRNIGRMALLLAGLPFTVPGTTTNRLCGSSLDAIIQSARAIWSEDADILVAGGVESMSRAPYAVPKNQYFGFGNLTAFDTALGWRFPNPNMEKIIPLESMGETAENIAERFGISRDAQDRFACESHGKAVRAQQQGNFNNEIVPIEIPQVKKGETSIITQDEGPRKDTSLEKLGKLPPVFRRNGTVTAGNSSSLNDGAAALLITSERKAREYSLVPMARIVSTGIAGVDPRIMGMGPVPATRLALGKANLKIQEIGLVELNEAFAAQSLAVIRELELAPEKVNVNGGAIALGHPLGCSGARIMTTLLHEMKRQKVRYGLATMCIGVGQGIAIIVENLVR